MAEIKEIKPEEFDETIKVNGLKLVDFWAPWCGTCRMMMSVVEDIQNQYPQIEVVKLDAGEFSDFAGKFDVSTLPTIILYKDGVEVERTVGFRQKAQWFNLISKHI